MRRPRRQYGATPFTNEDPAPSGTLMSLTVTRAGPGAASGTVADNRDSIACPGVCAFSYPEGTVVRLIANVSVTWSGAVTGTGTFVDVVMDAAKAVTATFP